MQKINKLLVNTNLSGKERALLLVHDRVNKQRYGKGILSDNDKFSISSIWRPRSHKDILEYNKYIKVDGKEHLLRLYLQDLHIRALLKITRTSRVLDSMYFSLDTHNNKNIFEGYINDKEVLDFMLNMSKINCDEVADQIQKFLPFGRIIYFIHHNDLLKTYGELLAFKDLYTKLSDAYSIDMGYLLDSYLKEYTEEINMLNREILYLYDKVSEVIYTENSYAYEIDFDTDKIILNVFEVEKVESGDYILWKKEFEVVDKFLFI